MKLTCGDRKLCSKCSSVPAWREGRGCFPVSKASAGNEALLLGAGEACALLDETTSSYNIMAEGNVSEAQMIVMYRQEGLKSII